MLLLVRKSVRKGVKVTHDKDPDIIGITLSREFFGMEQDLVVWFAYAPPASSPYSRGREKVLSCLESLLITNDNYEHSIILGDLNGKTACNADYLRDGSDNHSPITQVGTYVCDEVHPRNNMDENPVDGQGKMILDLCKTLNLRILNGRTSGDRWGNLTRFPLNRIERPSVLDYGICCSSLLEKILSFLILPQNELSDHCCISVSVDIKKPIGPSYSEHKEPSTKPPRLKFDADGIEKYKLNLTQDNTFQTILNNITGDTPQWKKSTTTWRL